MGAIPLIWLGLLTQTAGATDLEACLSGPPCYGSIQNAIDNAQTGDNIFIRAGSYFEQLDVDRGVNLIGDGEGVVHLYGFGNPAVLDIDTSDPVSISGVTVHGGGARRCILIDDGELTLQDMTCNGGTVAGDGGGIGGGLLAIRSLITADGVTFSENWAQIDGGAMHLSDESELTLSNSDIVDNSANRGGGIFVGYGSSLTDTGSSFDDNDASDFGGLVGFGFYYGGAIYADNATIALTDTNVNTGYSADEGAGLYATNSAVTISGGRFEDNQAEENGGAISVDATTLTMDDTTLVDNFAALAGGGLYIDAGTLSVTASAFTRNTAFWEDGGGIRVGGGAAVDLVDTDFNGNSTGGAGGSIAALWADSLDIVGGLHFNNSGWSAGAIQTWDDGNPRSFLIDGVTFNANYTNGILGLGGAIAHNGVGQGDGVELTIRDSRFTLNNTLARGGAIAANNAGGLVVEDSTFLYNYADDGGSLSIRSVQSAKLTRNYFCQNIASETGGAIYMDGGGDTRTWTNNIFAENASFADGGAVWMSGMQMKFINNTFAGNGSDDAGGALYVNASDLEWVNNLIMATTAGDGLIFGNGTVNRMDYNAWWQNNSIDTNVEAAVRTNDLVLNTPDSPVSNFTNDCNTSDFTIAYGGDLFDAGDPNILDPDGGPSDIGALGGPNADPDSWVDADGDGVATMWDCSDDDVNQGAILPWYPDLDHDGYGDLTRSAIMACDAPDDSDTWANVAGDCADEDEDIHPGADEYCDEIDTDCDGETRDPDAVDAEEWFADADRDGWGEDGTGFFACEPGVGFTDIPGDCDDNAGEVNPDSDEVWYDGVDQDCDGWSDFDKDLDGFDSAEHLDDGDDCDDGDGGVYPGAADGFGDTIDQDCNGVAAATWMSGGGGCGCDSQSGSGAGWFGLVLASLALRRRR